MDKKLNLHDLFGVLFPGAVVWFCLYVFNDWIHLLPVAKFDWSAALAMLPVAYVTGLAIEQTASRFISERRIALTLMDADDRTFSRDFKSQVKQAFEDVFKLPADTDDTARQAMFNSCYDYVIQQGKGIYVENHFASYALCRSMLLVTPFAALLAAWTVLRRPTLTPADYGRLLLILGTSVGVITTFWWAMNKFIRAFAAAVYRAFYSAYCDCNLPCAKGSAAAPQDDA